MEAIKNRREFETIQQAVEDLIKKADAVNGFENLPDRDIQLFKDYSIILEKYEKEALKLDKLRGRSELIIRMEEEMFNRRMTQKEFAKFLDVSETQLCGVLKGRISVSMGLAQKLHQILNIDGNIILENIKAFGKKIAKRTNVTA